MIDDCTTIIYTAIISESRYATLQTSIRRDFVKLI